MSTTLIATLTLTAVNGDGSFVTHLPNIYVIGLDRFVELQRAIAERLLSLGNNSQAKGEGERLAVSLSLQAVGPDGFLYSAPYSYVMSRGRFGELEAQLADTLLSLGAAKVEKTDKA